MALAGLAALVIWFVLALRGALLYLEVLAIPLALCGLYWGTTAHWIKRLVDLIIATILSQLVITMLMVLAAADLNKSHLSPTGSVGADMTTLFLAVAFLVLGSLALPMALRHVPAATEHAAAAASQISAPGRMTYMGSRIAGTTKMVGGSRGGAPAIVRQAGAVTGPLGVAATAGVGAAASVARNAVDAAGSAADVGTRGRGSSGPDSGGAGRPGTGAPSGSGATRGAATGGPERSSGAQAPPAAPGQGARGAPVEGSAVRGARGGTSRG